MYKFIAIVSNFMQKKIKAGAEKSFTLIEILLVLSILGILSSIIFVSVADHIDRARMVRSMNFASSIRRTLSVSEKAGWSFNSTSSNTVVNDDSGNANSLTLKGSAALSGDTPMRTIGGATSSDFSLRTLSESDYADAGDKSAFRPEAITISFWFKIDSFHADTAEPTIVSNYEVFPSGGYWVGVQKDWGIIDFRYFAARTNPPHDIIQVQIMSPANMVSTGKWYHLAVSYDGAGTGKMYLDGTKIAENSSTGASGPMYYGSSGQPLNLGRTSSLSPHGFDGYIENLEIYSSAF